MDDVLFSTPSVLETQHMFEQLNNAWKTGLIIAPEKIQTSTPYHYLGFVVNRQCITPQLTQIRTDKLSTLNELQKLLGDINWIRPSLGIAWNMEWSRAKTNRVLWRKCTDHSKHPLPTTKEKTLHMDITRWSTPKSDWLYSLQPKMEKLYTVSKNKSRSWLWLRSWTPYC